MTKLKAFSRGAIVMNLLSTKISKIIIRNQVIMWQTAEDRCLIGQKRVEAGCQENPKKIEFKMENNNLTLMLNGTSLLSMRARLLFSILIITSLKTVVKHIRK